MKIYNREPNPPWRTRKVLHEEMPFQDEARRISVGQVKLGERSQREESTMKAQVRKVIDIFKE